MNISSLYIDSVRVFMEYIDNSIDAAENENSLMVNLTGEDIQYKNKVEIKISISGKYYNTGKIKISDNAAGIKELRNVVEKIGNSEKKSQAWLNGQFGYGIYSFLAICDTLEILTKHSDNIYSEYIKITRSDFMIDDLNDLRFEIVTEHPHTPASGTEITLSGFSKDSWSEINVDLLKSEIESHFELLLQDPNIEIEIINSDEKSIICFPYDYNQHQGEIFDKTISIPVKGNKFDDLLGKNDIRIFLKITPKLAVERPPVLVSKNRRVMELWQLKFNSFRSHKRKELWNTPNITGFIDTKNLLNPTLARNDFKNDKNYKLVKKAILDTEDEVLTKFRQAVAANITSDFSEIESSFNSNLDSLIDFSSDEKSKFSPDDLVKLSDSGELLNVLVPHSTGSIASKFSTDNINTGAGKGSKKKKETDKSEVTKMEKSREFVIIPRSDENKLILKIDDSTDPIKDSTGKEKRSELFGNTVHIYKKHPDFMKRISTDRLWIEIVTSELITYLTSEMLIHYTNYSFQNNLNNKQPDRKEVLIFFTEWLYKLEDSLKNLIGKPLSK